MTGSDPHDTAARLPAHEKNVAHERFLAQLNEWLSKMPIGDRATGRSLHLPLVYIVGAPRSGTTLLSQLLAKYLEVGYINNLIARFWSRPLAGIRLSESCLGADARRTIVLRSTHGVTADIAGPHEFGYFWRQWLNLDRAATHHLTAAEAAGVDVDGLGGVLREEILGGFGRPVVFKNVICGLQAALLSRVHPNSLFIHVTRDPIATAGSILAARVARYGDPRSWWSLKPSTFDAIRRLPTPAQQVARQVRDCRDEFAAELSSSGVRALTVSYDEMCASPDALLARVCEALRPLGADLHPWSAVEPLAPSAGPALSRELHEELTAAFA